MADFTLNFIVFPFLNIRLSPSSHTKSALLSCQSISYILESFFSKPQWTTLEAMIRRRHGRRLPPYKVALM